MAAGPVALAQNSSDLPVPATSNEVFSSIGLPAPKLTPIRDHVSPTALPVKLLYDGPQLRGAFTLSIAVSQRAPLPADPVLQPVSQSTLHLKSLGHETEAVVTLPEIKDGLHIEAVLRDENENLVLETTHPLPVLSRDLRLLRLAPPVPFDPPTISIPDFTAVETIAGKIILPPKTALPPQSMVHIQLVENALAGGLSMKLAAQDSGPALAQNGEIPFALQRGIWERHDDPDLTLKAWISDFMGRKTFVMSAPVAYNGSEINYRLRLDGLKQGVETKRGRNLNPDLMAQTLVMGEAQFDPVIGIPGQARLQIKLSQDRGDFNNPILAEQTLILRGMETSIPFSLTTDSTHFDPYAPAPFLSASLTDSSGRVYYTSGEIRAREGRNSIRLYPR
jgi:uncharacterized lipoprotein YbaY